MMSVTTRARAVVKRPVGLALPKLIEAMAKRGAPEDSRVGVELDESKPQRATGADPIRFSSSGDAAGRSLPSPKAFAMYPRTAHLLSLQDSILLESLS